MSQKYALPCQCGKSVPVDSRQAGETVTCTDCGKPLEIPKLRELRELNVIQPDGPSRPTRKWSTVEGSLFVTGVLALLIGCSAGAYTTFLRSQYNVRPPEPADIQFRYDMEEIPLVDSWQLWQQYSKHRIETRPTPYHVQARLLVAQLNRWLFVFGGIATLGLLAVLGSLARIVVVR